MYIKIIFEININNDELFIGNHMRLIIREKKKGERELRFGSL